jgi:thymidylate synthase (FAD)
MASLSVKSSRYTLKELKEDVEAMKPDSSGDIDMDIVAKYCVLTDDDDVNEKIGFALYDLALMVDEGKANDKTKYCMPEAYKTSLVWTINARSLQNFLALRTSKAALWEIRDIAYAVYYQIPKSHRFLFKEFVNNKEK